MNFNIVSKTIDKSINLNSIYMQNYPVVYILNNEKKVYIGETTNADRRIKTHMKSKDKKDLKNLNIITSQMFNKSAIYNIETNLINAFLADEQFEIVNKKQISDVPVHEYYNKEYYNDAMFREIFDELKDKLLIRNSLEQLRNKDIYKISPFTSLSYDQLDLRDEIMSRIEVALATEEKRVFIIKGEAGTGKSVVISTLFKYIMDNVSNEKSNLYKKENYLLVNHNEMIKTYHTIAQNVSSIKKKYILKPTSFINKIEKSDVTIVDEAHLLLSKSDSYNSYRGSNQLKDIIGKSQFTIIVYDEKQYLKAKSFWNSEKLNTILSDVKNDTFILREQFRMNASNTIIEWIDNIVENKKIDKINNIVENDYEFQIFDDANEMYEKIKEKNEEYGLSRIVSTFDYQHKKDGGTYYVVSGDFRLQWNKDYNEAWAENEDSINEVGSTYTIQGFDLNYVGVIIGPSISLKDSKGNILVNTHEYMDVEAFRGASEFEDPNYVKERIILNSLNILLKRGVKGLYVHFTDEAINEWLNDYYSIF